MTDDDGAEGDPNAADDGAFGPGGLEVDTRDVPGESNEPEGPDGDGAGDGLPEDTGENIFGGPLDQGPITAGRPEAENVLFVLVGILVGTLVMMRLMGAI